MDELRKKTLIGSFWMMIERFGYLTIQFVSNLVLARLLSPDDFGVIGILMVFITLANVFIDSGFSASLIQKKEISEADKSTVFYINLGLASVVYIIIYFTSPWIADFFHNESIASLLRVLGIVLLIDSFCAIQNTLLSRDMNFKLLTKIKLIAILIAAVVAIYLAYSGFGVWSLIVQYLLYSTIRTITTWLAAKWRPILSFSKDSFRTLFSFGSKIMMASFLAELYVNFQQILIGRYFKPADLGYYSQARQFQQIPTGTISQVINSVAFPAYAKLQNDRLALRDLFRQNVRIVAYFNTAIMILLASIAEPLIILLYSSKWIGSIAYFQFLCIGFGVFLAIHQCSLSVLKAVGHSDYVLKLEIIKKILGVLFIFIGLNIWGIWGILYALALNSLLELFINGYYLNKTIHYSGLQQLRDMIPSIIVSGLSGIVTLLCGNICFFNGNEFVVVLCSICVYLICFALFSWVGRLYGFKVLINLVSKLFLKMKNR